MQRLREAAEKAKIELSSQSTTTINLPYITVDADKNPLFLDETLSRAEFQRITRTCWTAPVRRSTRSSRTPASPSARSTTSCSWVAPPACPP